jgi:hypothetical protein
LLETRWVESSLLGWVVEAAPRLVVADELGFVESDHAFGERIVIRITARPDAVYTTGIGEPFGLRTVRY